MGLLHRSRGTVAASTWQPLTGKVEYVLDDEEAGDDGDPGSHGYAVTFYLASAPGAILTVCVYTTYAPYGTEDDRGLYRIGYCCDYAHSTGPEDELWWTVTAYHYGADPYTDLQACDEAAREIAQQLATIGVNAPAADGLGFFSWDGSPW